MALIKCKECGKQVSSNAASCPACGNPIGGGGSVGNIAFENRIEEYKKHGYGIVKRDGDTIQMIKGFGKSKAVGISAALSMLILPVGIPMIIAVIARIFWSLLSSVIIFFSLVIVAYIIFFQTLALRKVNITLTKNGKLEESGNVLKNK